MNERKNGIVHNMNVRQFIGDVVDQVKLSEQIKTGRATLVADHSAMCGQTVDLGTKQSRSHQRRAAKRA